MDHYDSLSIIADGALRERNLDRAGKNLGTKRLRSCWSASTTGVAMHDVVYLRGLAERYRKLARRFRHVSVRERLEVLAEDLEERIRELQRPLPGQPIIRAHRQVN
jgi:hypothetical protein